MIDTKIPLFYIIAVFSLLLSACGKPDHQLVQQQIFTFGTLVDISIWTDKPAQAKLLIQQLNANFDQQHQQWHPNNKDSSLSIINSHLKNSETAILSPDLLALIKLSIQFSKHSQNLFNPAIGQLIDLWHFDHQINQPNMSAKSELNSIKKPPSEQQVYNLIDLTPNMFDLSIDENQLSSTNPAVKLNLGAFAKGYAVDLAIKTINKAGFNNALVNAGGDIKALGSKGDKAWKIGIRNPFYQQQPNMPVLASITLKNNQSIMTSGDYERYFNYQGKRYHHIIDPRTGYPANGFHSVTIVHADAALADAAATALFIAGMQDWKKVAKKMGIKQAILVTSQNEILITKDLHPHITMITPPLTDKSLPTNQKIKVISL